MVMRLGLERTGLLNNLRSVGGSLQPHLQANFVTHLRRHKIILPAGSGLDLNSLTDANLSSRVTASKLSAAIDEFNLMYLDAQNAIPLADVTHNIEEPSPFSRVCSGLLWRLTGNTQDVANYSVRRNSQEVIDFNQRFGNTLQLATTIALRLSGQTPQSIVDGGYYGRQGAGCPEEVRSLFGDPLTPNNPHYGGLLGEQSPLFQLLRQPGATGSEIVERTRQMTNRGQVVSQGESTINGFLPGVVNNPTRENFNQLLDAMAQVAVNERLPFGGACLSLISHLRTLASQSENPLRADSIGNIMRATQSSLIQLKTILTATPRLNKFLIGLSGLAMGSSVIYGLYRLNQIIRFFDDPGSLALSLLLFGSESHFLGMSLLTNSAVWRSQWSLRGAHGQSWLPPLRSGLELDPFNRDDHAEHLSLNNEPPECTIRNIHSQTNTAWLNGRGSACQVSDNSDLLISRLGVEAAVAGCRKKTARMEVVRLMIERMGVGQRPDGTVDHTPAYYFALALGGQTDETLDHETVFWAINRLQTFADNFMIRKRDVRRFGRMLAEEFLRVNRGLVPSERQPVERQWIFERLRDLGVDSFVADNVATLVFNMLDSLVQDGCLTFLGNKIFSGNRLNVEEREAFVRGAASHGIQRPEAERLLSELEARAGQINSLAASIVAEDPGNRCNQTGEFDFTRTREGLTAFARLSNPLWRIFALEQESGNIPEDLPRKYGLFCERALLEPLDKKKPFKRGLVERANLIGQELAEAVSGLPNLYEMLRNAFDEVLVLAAAGAGPQEIADKRREIWGQVMALKRTQIEGAVIAVLARHNLTLEQRNRILASILENFDSDLFIYEMCVTEMLQKICRRVGDFNARLNAATTLAERRRAMDGIVSDLLSLNEMKIIISVTLKRFGFTGTGIENTEEAVKIIEGMLNECGDLTNTSGRNRLIHLLQSRLGWTRENAEAFANRLIREFENTVLPFREAVELMITTVNNGHISRDEPTDLHGRTVDLGNLTVNLDEIKKLAEKKVIFAEVNYAGGGKGGTSNQTFFGDTVSRQIADLGRRVVDQMLEERLFGLRRVPKQILTDIDRVINGYERNMPATIDPHFRDPRFVASFFVRQFQDPAYQVSARECVRNFFDFVGFRNSDVPTDVREKLENVAAVIQGGLILGRIVNAFGSEGLGLNVENFMAGQGFDRAGRDLLDQNIRNELMIRGRNIQILLRSGALQLEGNSYTLRLNPGFNCNRQEEILAQFFNREMRNFSEFNPTSRAFRISGELLGALGEVNIVFEIIQGRDALGEAINPREQRQSLLNGFSVQARDNFVGEVMELAALGRSTQDIAAILVPDFQNILGNTFDPSRFADPIEIENAQNRLAGLGKAIAGAVSAVKQSLFRAEVTAKLSEALHASIGSGTAPDYQSVVDSALTLFSLNFNLSGTAAEPNSEVGQCRALGLRLAGITESVRVRQQEGLLGVTFSPDGRQCDIRINHSGFSESQRNEAQEELKKFFAQVIFDEAPTALQTTERRIFTEELPEFFVINVGTPGLNNVEARVAFAPEFRRLASVIDQMFNLIFSGAPNALINTNHGRVTLQERAIELGAQAAIDFNPAVFPAADIALLQRHGLFNPANQQLTVTIASESILNQILNSTPGQTDYITSEQIRARLRELRELSRVRARRIVVQLIPEVFQTMADLRNDLAAQGVLAENTLFDLNYFKEPEPVVPLWKFLGGIAIDDADVLKPKYGSLDSTAHMLEHPGLVHFSYGNVGRNPETTNVAACFGSGGSSYYGHYTTIHHSTLGMHPSAGSGLCYSTEAMDESARMRRQDLNKISEALLTADHPPVNDLMHVLGFFDCTSESEDYATLEPFERMPWLGNEGGNWIRTKYLQWFNPHPLFRSVLSDVRMSLGSNQENLLDAQATFGSRWARGNMNVLVTKVLSRKHPMGFFPKLRYASLGAYWLTGLHRLNLNISPLAFMALGRQAIVLGPHPEIFFPLVAGTFLLNFGSFIASMHDRGYRVMNLETLGCVLNDYALMGKLNRSFMQGVILGKRPAFAKSGKKNPVPEVALLARSLPLEYGLKWGNLAFTLYAASFAFSNPLMLGAGAWAGYNWLLERTALNTMNQGVFVPGLDGRGAPFTLLSRDAWKELLTRQNNHEAGIPQVITRATGPVFHELGQFSQNR